MSYQTQAMVIDLSRRLFQELREKLDTRGERHSMGDELLKSIIERAVDKCNLVTREEFDTQKAVLLRSREKLEALESHLTQTSLNNGLTQGVNYSDRATQVAVDALFVKRWSPRAFSEGLVTKEQLTIILEAARWAPSCYNDQPWRFLVSHSNNTETYLDLLVEANQVWAKKASRIGFIIATKNFRHNDKPNEYATFDAGSAWMSMSLQAAKLGLAMHGMAGINKEAIYEAFKLDREKFEVVMGFAIGHRGDLKELPEALQKKEQPSDRLSLDSLLLSELH